MSLISSPSVVAPRVRPAPPPARNDAELIVELAAAYGTELDPWQVPRPGGFLDDMAAGRLTHRDEPLLNDAVAGARRRPIGEAGAFGWDRRDGSVFVAPLVAVTLARFGAVTARRTGGAVFV